MSNSAKSAIHFPLALLLLLGLGQADAPHPSPLPQGERGQETSLYALAPLLPSWEKGLGDEGLSMLSLESLSRFELIPTLTALGIQVAGSPNPQPAEALFARAIEIAEAMPTLTQRTGALLTIARRLREVNQTARAQKLVARAMKQTLEYAAQPVKESYEEPSKQRDLVTISEQLAAAGEVDRALRLANTKISIKVSKGEALNGIAAALARQGNTKKAMQLLNEAVRLVKSDRDDSFYLSNGSCGNDKFAVFQEIAKTLSLISELDKALKIAETLGGCYSASGEYGQQYQAWAYLGILSHLGNIEQLQRTWNSAKKISDPVEQVMAWSGIADKLIDVGEIPLVLSIATQISKASKITDYPNYPLNQEENLQNIALKLAQKQKLESALQVTQLLANAPDRQGIVRKEIAGQFARARQLDKALRVAESVADSTMKTRTKLTIVQNLQKIGLTTEAKVLFETLIPVLSPETAPELVAIGQSDRALKLLDKLDGKVTKNGQVLAETAMQFVELNQLEPALKLADQIKNDENRHPLLLAIAAQQVKLGKFDQALVLALPLKKSNVWGLSTNLEQLLANIAKGLWRSGQLAKARQVAEAVSREDEKVALLAELAVQK